jgi:hypothetical protein
MMIEVLAATSLKATFPIMGSAWTLTLCEGQLGAAAVAIPALVGFALFSRSYPGRLRGKRGKGPP